MGGFFLRPHVFLSEENFWYMSDEILWYNPSQMCLEKPYSLSYTVDEEGALSRLIIKVVPTEKSTWCISTAIANLALFRNLKGSDVRFIVVQGVNLAKLLNDIWGEVIHI